MVYNMGDTNSGYMTFPSKKVMSGKSIGSFLASQGFVRTSGKGSHAKYKNPLTGKIVSVPMSNDNISGWLLAKIRREYEKATRR